MDASKKACHDMKAHVGVPNLHHCLGADVSEVHNAPEDLGGWRAALRANFAVLFVHSLEVTTRFDVTQVVKLQTANTIRLSRNALRRMWLPPE